MVPLSQERGSELSNEKGFMMLDVSAISEFQRNALSLWKGHWIRLFMVSLLTFDLSFHPSMASFSHVRTTSVELSGAWHKTLFDAQVRSSNW